MLVLPLLHCAVLRELRTPQSLLLSALRTATAQLVTVLQGELYSMCWVTVTLIGKCWNAGCGCIPFSWSFITHLCCVHVSAKIQCSRVFYVSSPANPEGEGEYSWGGKPMWPWRSCLLTGCHGELDEEEEEARDWEVEEEGVWRWEMEWVRDPWKRENCFLWKSKTVLPVLCQCMWIKENIRFIYIYIQYIYVFSNKEKLMEHLQLVRRAILFSMCFRSLKVIELSMCCFRGQNSDKKRKLKIRPFHRQWRWVCSKTKLHSLDMRILESVICRRSSHQLCKAAGLWGMKSLRRPLKKIDIWRFVLVCLRWENIYSYIYITVSLA